MTALPAGAVPAPVSRSRLGWTAAMGGAVVVTLTRPGTWVVGLAGFLAGGGLLLVTLPVAVLPTLSGIQNELGGPIATLVVGTPSAALIALIAATIAVSVVALVAGIIVGAWAERAGILLVLETAADDGLVAAPALAGVRGVLGAAGVRLLSLVPVAIAAGLAWQPLYDASYRELVLPNDLSSPLVVRVIRAVPVPLIAIVVTWLVSDSAAALGVRRLVVERRSVLRAWALGWLDLLRSPLRSAGTALLGVAVLALLLGPSMLAATAGWARVRDALLSNEPLIGTMVAVIVWIATWFGALVLAGVASAIRVAAWTLDAYRRP